MRATRLAALYLGIVFLAGAVFGLVGDRLYQRTARAAGPQEFRQRFLDNLQRDLALSPEQLTQVTVILDETGQRFRELRERMAPDFQAIRDTKRERILAVLTPDQQSKYLKILEGARKQQHEKHRHLGGPQR